MMAPPQTISSFGLGTMGAALARSFLNAGLKLTVWNRSPDRESVKSLVKDGATFEKDPTAALKASELIVICLLDYASVYEVFDKIDEAAFQDKIIVHLTTANAEDGPRMADWAREKGVKWYFDGAIMNTPNHVSTPHAFTFIAGETQAAFDAIAPALTSTGKWEYLGEDTSSAALHDGAILAGMYGMFGGCLTAIALLSKAQPPRKTVEVVRRHLLPGLRSLSEWVEEASGMFDEGDWGGYTATNEVNAFALKNVMRSCEVQGISTGALEGAYGLFDRAVREGMGQGGMAYCVNYLLEGGKKDVEEGGV